MNRYELKEEMMKAEEPYSFWISQNEKWRGRDVPPELIQSFRKKYTFRCSGRYVNDPEVYERFALYASNGDYDIIYCDEDIVSGGKRHDPFFKPDFSPDTLESFNYMGNFMAVSSSCLERERKGDVSLSPEKVCHIPEVLFHSSVPYSHEYPKTDNEEEDMMVDRVSDGISVIILSKDHPQMLKRCVSSLLNSGMPDNTEIIVIDNGSTMENKALYAEYAEEYGFIYMHIPQPFNYSTLCNRGASMAHGRFLLFLNDDTEASKDSHDVVSKMCGKAAQCHVGAVGIKLLYPGGTKIQHCGITMLDSGPSHKLCGYEDSEQQYFGYSKKNIDVMAVTGACLCVEKAKFDAAGGFDEQLPLAYNDVDLCIRLLDRGLYNVSMNSIYMFHHESASRIDDRENSAAYLMLQGYKEYLYEKHCSFFRKGDPFYSRNLTHTELDFRPDVQQAWEGTGVQRAPLKSSRFRTGKVNVRMNLECFRYRVSDAYGNEDFFEARGWAFAKGPGFAAAEPCVIINDGTQELIFRAEHMYRKDVKEVFAGERYACMAGFISRISASALESAGLRGKCSLRPAFLKNKKICKGEDECQIEII